MKNPVQDLEGKTRILFLQEEYGYRHWVGVIPSHLTTENIIEWWKSLPSVMGMFFNPSGGFPMPLYEVDDIAPDDADLATWQWVDSEGQTHILDRDDVVLFAHTHEEDDSYLKVVGGDYIYHAGSGDMEEEEDEDELEDLPEISDEEKEKLKQEHPHVYKVIYEQEKLKEEHPHLYPVLFEESEE